MQALDLLAEMFSNADVKVVPRIIATPGTPMQLRGGPFSMGKVQGLVLGPGGELVMQFECNQGTVEVWMDGEAAVEAIKALAALPCVYPEKLRRSSVTRENISAKDARDVSDLGLLGRFRS